MATQNEIRFMEILSDILVLAHDCRSDMQGRLSDDEHKRAFEVLGSIERRAYDAIRGYGK